MKNAKGPRWYNPTNSLKVFYFQWYNREEKQQILMYGKLEPVHFFGIFTG